MTPATRLNLELEVRPSGARPDVLSELSAIVWDAGQRGQIGIVHFGADAERCLNVPCFGVHFSVNVFECSVFWCFRRTCSGCMFGFGRARCVVLGTLSLLIRFRCSLGWVRRLIRRSVLGRAGRCSVRFSVKFSVRL